MVDERNKSGSLCAVCMRDVQHSPNPMVCMNCLHSYTTEALRLILRLHSCAECAVRGAWYEMFPFGKSSWLCSECATSQDTQAAYR